MIICFAAKGHCFVLNNAMTLGQGNSAFATVVSTNKISTKILSSYNTLFENYAYGTIAQYGLLDNVDVMIGFGGISYALTPDIGLDMMGGNFFGGGLKYNIINENAENPLSVAFIAQYMAIPTTLLDTGTKKEGSDYDAYLKIILSKNFPAFFPFIALGINSRNLKIGDASSASTIGQIDIGYGTPITEKMFIGVELNWSSYWHDEVMDDILGTATLSNAIGYSFGIQYLL